MREESFRPPVTLRGIRVRLVPLSLDYRDALVHAARDPEMGRFLSRPPGQTADSVGRYIGEILQHRDEGTELPFVVLLGPDDRVVGASRYLNIERENDSVELGTWIDSSLWRSPVNTEVKFLLLRYAFEEQGAHRVVLQTDLRNERSQRAIARLGAVREGVMREDRVVHDGYRRSSVVYSILADEWPGVRRRLERSLARPWVGDRPAASGP
ncbi:MAG TPA: GNAT family protein [Thermoplasmata archaeon]|nr:GNAT family protein [Thermoplasmata archaeon]